MSIRIPATKPRFHRATAYHEAGHVVAACRLLDGIDHAFVYLRPRERFRANTSLGQTVLRDFNELDALVPTKQLQSHDIDVGLRWIVTLMVGPFAEARYMRRSVDAIMSSGGRNDMRGICDIFRLLTRGDHLAAATMTDDAVGAAQRLVRSDWHKIAAVADELASEGIIEGYDALLEDIEPIDDWLFPTM